MPVTWSTYHLEKKLLIPNEDTPPQGTIFLDTIHPDYEKPLEERVIDPSDRLALSIQNTGKAFIHTLAQYIKVLGLFCIRLLLTLLAPFIFGIAALIEACRSLRKNTASFATRWQNFQAQWCRIIILFTHGKAATNTDKPLTKKGKLVAWFPVLSPIYSRLATHEAQYKKASLLDAAALVVTDIIRAIILPPFQLLIKGVRLCLNALIFFPIHYLRTNPDQAGRFITPILLIVSTPFVIQHARWAPIAWRQACKRLDILTHLAKRLHTNTLAFLLGWMTLIATAFALTHVYRTYRHREVAMETRLPWYRNTPHAHTASRPIQARYIKPLIAGLGLLLATWAILWGLHFIPVTAIALLSQVVVTTITIGTLFISSELLTNVPHDLPKCLEILKPPRTFIQQAQHNKYAFKHTKPNPVTTKPNHDMTL